MSNSKIYLDYDPQYQGIVKTVAYLWFVCFAIFMHQVFQLALAPLAYDYVSALTVSGVTEAVKSAYLVSANLLYTMTEMGDAFVTLVLFNGAFVSMLFIAFQKPHPKWLGWWIIVLAILPFGRVIGLPILGLANATLNGLFFVVMGFFMLRFKPLLRKEEKK